VAKSSPDLQKTTTDESEAAPAGYKPRTKYNADQEEFVRVWQDSKTVQEACDRLKMPYSITLARVSLYRRRGVKLKKMPRKNSRRLDVDGLNRLIDETTKKVEAERAKNDVIQLSWEDVREIVETALKHARGK
jgi:hypothetical protein